MLKDIAVASGIASLCLAYVLFTYQQLFSPYAVVKQNLLYRKLYILHPKA